MALPRSSLETYDYVGGSSEKMKISTLAGGASNSNSMLFRAVGNYHHQEEAAESTRLSLINFKTGLGPITDGSLLSFGQSNCSVWNQLDSSRPLLEDHLDGSCFETGTASTAFVATTTSCSKEIVNQQDEWFYSDAFPEPGIAPEPNLLKRPNNTGDSSTQTVKKQCTKKAKQKSSKDPQSIAAKNRRERISERLKILQDLVPNGSKVDLVTMLEKAISYVQFLQLQVKVLATDEFWPAQGRKAPDVSQVKEAIDAILSSQRDRNSCSSSSK